MAMASGYLTIVRTARSSPTTTLVIDELRQTQNISKCFHFLNEKTVVQSHAKGNFYSWEKSGRMVGKML